MQDGCDPARMHMDITLLNLKNDWTSYVQTWYIAGDKQPNHLKKQQSLLLSRFPRK